MFRSWEDRTAQSSPAFATERITMVSWWHLLIVLAMLALFLLVIFGLVRFVKFAAKDRQQR